jgi:deaminated glutathione amidase
MQPFAIAGLQLELRSAGDNLAKITAKVDELLGVYPWVQMVLLSELAACGSSVSRAEPLPGPTEQGLAALAAKHGIWLVPGSLFEASGGKVYNTAPVIDPKGRVVARYRKLFPFRPYEHGVEAGDSFVVFEVPNVGRFGLSICYDLWFPETARQLVALGAEVILHPVYTTTLDRDVELAIARATAATQQCWVFDVNGAGECGIGRSIIVGPAGEVVHQAGNGEEIMPLEIDLERVRRGREHGLLGLGQPLKSFRDSKVQFDVYRPGARFAADLGPLEKPERPR